MSKLIGTNPNQVPSNADLGTAAFADTTSFLKTNHPVLSDTKSVIRETTTDRFVYDTTLDSDGGAWRKRCSHLSWYNEPLNTATRGSRREFPSLAVIICTSKTVTIYDGDDPDLPMWMVFNSPTTTTGRTFAGYSTNNQINCVSMLNAQLVIGSNATANIVRFLHDNSLRTGSTASWYTKQTVAQRNTEYYNTQKEVDLRIRNSYTITCDMTITDSAPIDNVTKLHVPTIALATSQGISVLKDNETVVDIYSTNASYTRSRLVKFNDKNQIIHDLESTSYRYVRTHDIPKQDLPVGQWSPEEDHGITLYINDVNGDFSSIEADSPVRRLGKNSAGYNKGLVLWHEEPEIRKSLIAYINSTYNTGWMVGATKAALLSEIIPGYVDGKEYISNGTFDSDYSGWSQFSFGAGSPTWQVTNGELVITLNDSYDVGVHQAISGLKPGRMYEVAYETTVTTAFNSGNSTLHSSIGSSLNSSADGTSLVISNMAQGTKYRVRSFFYAIDATYYIMIRTGSSTNRQGQYKIDNVTVKEAVIDRSHKKFNMTCNGLIRKRPVASGADLISYDGFDNNNFFEQAYNTNLNFGTNDYSIIGWVYPESSPVGPQVYLSKSLGNDSNRIAVFTHPTEGVAYYTPDSGSVSSNTLPELGKWSCIIYSRVNGRTTIYLNGKPIKRSTTSYNLTGEGHVLRIGRDYQGGSSTSNQTKLSLWRLSASGVTDEQAMKVYQDEHELFKEGAQSTFYGESTEVRGIDNDEYTGLMHIGTTDGRSDFMGLRRVSYSEDSVDNGVSASKGMIVED